MVYSKAMKQAGKELNYETMLDCLEGFRDFDTKGLCPPITFKKGDHIGGKHCKFFKADVERGLLIPITGWK